MSILVKISNCWHFNIMRRISFMVNSAEHENNFITSGSGHEMNIQTFKHEVYHSSAKFSKDSGLLKIMMAKTYT